MIQYQEYSFPLNLPFPQSVENRGRSESKICKPFVAEEKEQKPSTFKPYVIHENTVSQTSSTNLENRLLVSEKGGGRATNGLYSLEHPLPNTTPSSVLCTHSDMLEI